jgi:hypothetical protein
MRCGGSVSLPERLEDQDGLRILIDLQKLDKEKAVKALEHVFTAPQDLNLGLACRGAARLFAFSMC